MTSQSFFSRYLQLYFWMTISLILNFVSMFVVTPMLTSNQVVYGVYILCISSTIFLSYADLGFVGAAYKFASEHYARGEHKQVLRVIGFVSFILLAFSLVFSIGMIACSIHPEFIIHGSIAHDQRHTAQHLFIVLAVSSPLIIFQRSVQMLFGVRVEDYFVQRINIGANLLKIGSVAYFFRNGSYDVVGFFAFSQGTMALASVVSIALASKRYQFRLGEFFRTIRWSRDLFLLMKGFAASAILGIFSWVLFQEFDPFAISSLLGADKLAIYAIGLTLASFLRNLLGILFNPFMARFNHFIGVSDTEGLKRFLTKVVQITIPVTTIPLFALLLLLGPFILCWTGVQYRASVPLATILLSLYMLSTFNYLGGILLIAQKRLKENNWLSIGSTVVYWVFLFGSYRWLGLYSFAIGKAAIMILSGLFYLYVSWRFVGSSFNAVMKGVFIPMFMPIIILVIASHYITTLLPMVKGKGNLLEILFATVVLSALGIIAYTLGSPVYRGFAREYGLKIKELVVRRHA